eukprot:TRINITY_DN16968_c0_g1_i1.p1 TRINITY_DN16968_c0_g1~~TRINITY_DN16968_c0_g1_i1.p1  ORF type:complete len:247 (+),score=46.96 TRINITY_DN16968_c0_g1_i1:110-850(+)
MNSLVLLVLCLITLISVVNSEYYLEQRKVILIDHTPTSSGARNYLFRGSEPKINQNGEDIFAYTLLDQYLRNASQSIGVDFPSNSSGYFLIDLKLTYGTIWEKPDIELETKFFQQHPSLGLIGINITFGDIEDPKLLDQKDRDEKAQTLSQWQHDNLPARMLYLRELLYTPSPKPLVIYVHCECGCDRTGEVIGSYALKFLNMTFPQVMKWNDNIAERPILPPNEFAIDWYCFYLSLVDGYEKLDC